MKSLLESITTVNEDNDLNFNTILDGIKAFFCYDKLSFGQKGELADMFKSNNYRGGVIFEKIREFWRNTNRPRPDKDKIYESVEMCSKIYEALKP